MSRIGRIGLLAFVVAGSLWGVPAALAHDCPKNEPPTSKKCRETPPYGGWRPNWIPLFDVPERDDDTEGEGGSPTDESRTTYQRWRDEYGCYSSMCVWFEPSLSGPSMNEEGNPPDGQPNSVHTGIAADHTWLEGFHQSEDHTTSEGTHDGHGGTVYADICLAEDSHYYGAKRDVGCADDNDSEIGIVVVDHLGCTYGCQDEYHIVRPLDREYTDAQMEETPKDTQYIVEHPDDWLCGYAGYGSDASCPPRAAGLY